MNGDARRRRRKTKYYVIKINSRNSPFKSNQMQQYPFKLYFVNKVP